MINLFLKKGGGTMKKEKLIMFCERGLNILAWVLSFSLITIFWLDFTIFIFSLLGSYKSLEDIKEFVFVVIGTYVSSLYIIEKVDEDTFSILKYIFYLFLPIFFSIFLLKESKVGWLYLIPMIISSILVFLSVVCYFRPKVLKMVLGKIWFEFLYPTSKKLKIFIHKKND